MQRSAAFGPKVVSKKETEIDVCIDKETEKQRDRERQRETERKRGKFVLPLITDGVTCVLGHTVICNW